MICENCPASLNGRGAFKGGIPFTISCAIRVWPFAGELAHQK